MKSITDVERLGDLMRRFQIVVNNDTPATAMSDEFICLGLETRIFSFI